MVNSIFANMSAIDLNNIDQLNSYPVNLSHVDYTDIYVNSKGEALFAFTLPNLSVCCVQMPSLTYPNSQHGSSMSNTNNQNLPFKFEINQPNLVKRLWSGITR